MSALTQALPLLSIVAGGVIALAAFGRDPKADEHDLSDYREASYQPTLAPERRNWPLADQQRADYTWGYADDILPPVPEGMDAGSPIYRALISEQIVAEQMREQFGTTDPDRIADVMLREIRDEALAGAR